MAGTETSGRESFWGLEEQGAEDCNDVCLSSDAVGEVNSQEWMYDLDADCM